VSVDETVEHEFRTVGVFADPDAEVEIGEIEGRMAYSTGHRRSVKVSCSILDKEAGTRRKSRKTEEPEAEKLSEGGQSGSAKGIDEGKLTAKVSRIVMAKVENMIVDLLSSTGGSGGGVKLDKGEARVLMNQLSSLQGLKDDSAKLKALIGLKFDKVVAENELANRITREEFYDMLLTIFPGNAALVKAIASLRRKNLPPLPDSETETARARAREQSMSELEEHLHRRHKRQIHTALPPTLVPARNSRLLALNQRFLKGNDGKYYLRDIGGDSNVPIPGTGGTTRISVNAEQAFDFQPFMPAVPVRLRSDDEPSERIPVPTYHRAKTPPDAID
jgi:hypothetical protein